MTLAWRYCYKCGEPLTLDHCPFNRTVSEELDILEQEHSLHLCSSCTKTFATCDAKEIVFGSCIGNDNVIHCDSFEK